jgi:Fe-S cluster assembly iron-binding protein IscA
MITVTDSAANMIKRNKAEGKVIRMLLASVNSDGANYGLALGDLRNNDVIFHSNGVKIHMSPQDAELLSETIIDYVNDDRGTGYIIRGPINEQTGDDANSQDYIYNHNHDQPDYRLKSKFKYDVFICHSSKDKPLLKSIINEFMKNEICYWIDAEQIKFGDRISEKIENGIKNSKCIMPCLSRNLIKSSWCRTEYNSIINAELSGRSDRIVIPLQLDKIEDDDIPLLLKDKRRVFYNNKEDFIEFLDFIKKCRL